jgi:NAD(P)-dependent dehydrogenase (short-subunit alcohol dehydrogenase family)
MKVAVITGSSRGIGRSCALQCASRGMGVVVTYNSHRPGADQVVDEIERLGGKAVALELDVGRTETLAEFARQVAARLEQTWRRNTFDYLVNNAGAASFKLIEAVTETEFDAMLNVHLKGPFFLTQALLPMIAPGGAIVNVSSATTRVATPGVAPYAAMKGGLEVLTRYMAKEFGERQIRANAVSPGPIRTDLGGNLLDSNPEFARLLASQTALGRVGEPDDAARAIAMLLSEDSQWINAQTIEVGGGYNI